MVQNTFQEQALNEKADTLYEQYGKPLEKQYEGQFVAIAEDGRIQIDTSLPKLLHEAKEVLGPGNFIFKIGEGAVGKWL